MRAGREGVIPRRTAATITGVMKRSSARPSARLDLVVRELKRLERRGGRAFELGRRSIRRG